MSSVLAASPFFKRARGVADATPSNSKFVIVAAKEIRRNTLPPKAGFIKFWPNPPNNILTTTIAKTEPNTACHTGNVCGKLSAKRSPVTTALRSFIVLFLPTAFSNKNSDKTHVIIHTATSKRALSPKLKIPKIVVGMRAIMT